MNKNSLPSLQKVISIVGPTASGKTSLSVEIARLIGGEIISADSRQTYRGLDLGSGKVTKKEMKGVPHYLLDVANPKRALSVVQYEKLATRAIRDILKRGKVPIICGGTGFYVDAVLTNLSFPKVPANEKFRRELEKLSTSELYEKLKKVDPIRAENIDPRNARRIIRAIEIAEALGAVPQLNEATERYHTLTIGLTLPKEELYQRIHDRLLARMKRGMVAEAKRLHSQGLSWRRMESLGLEYRFMAQFLQDKLSKEKMIADLETAIRQFSKRQMVWFKRNKNIHWFHPTESAAVSKKVTEFLKS